MRTRPFHIALTILAAVALCAPAVAQERKRRLLPEEYGQWERLGQSDISDDGRWLFTSISKVDGDPRLVIKSSDGPQAWTIENGTRASFTEDSKWVVFTLTVPKDQAEELRRQKKRVENKMGVHSLETGDAVIFESVASWRLVKGGQHLLVHRYTAPDGGKAGGDFEIFNLDHGTTMPFGNVRSYVPHSEGGLVAIHTVSAAGNEGIQVVNVESGNTHTIAWSKSHYRSLTWAEESDTLGFLAGEEQKEKVGDANAVVLARGFRDGGLMQTGFYPAELEEFPEGMRISEGGGLQLSSSGESVVFGIADWKDADKSKPNPDDVAGVEIWHTRDVIVMPLQGRTAAQEMNRTTRCAWRPSDGVFVQFAEPELDRVRVSPDHKVAVADDPRPYATSVKVNGLEHVDVVVIDVFGGDRRTLIERAVSNAGGFDASSVSLSPDAGFAAYFDGEDWMLDSLADGRLLNLTKGLPVPFHNRLDDHTVPKPPAASQPVWFENDEGLVLQSNYDAFLVDLETGTAERMTEGENGLVRYRIFDAGFDEDGLRAGDPHYFTYFDTRSKASGFYRWSAGGDSKLLTINDSRVSWTARSADSDRVLFSMQTFSLPPSLFLTNLEFSAAKQVARTNPQQEKYRWGRAELVDYKAMGQDLQGILLYPADYTEGLRYPMITYVYERMSDGLHSYRTPGNTSPYDQQHFSQAGYFVFMPDIVYRDRNPGKSAVECIEAGVQAVLDSKVGVDAERVGLTGHSWGGYETVFVATQSKMFSAYVAGAPLTELISMYSSFYWNWGQANQVIFEVSQGRMEVPWWEDLRSYIDNSPLFHAGDISAPMLVEVGTVDGAVDWRQGQYLYNTLRRMGKNMVMLVYANENHGLARPANQKDYAMRARHFFDVYLKGSEAERWVTEGVPFTELGDELKPTKKDGG